ncbi:MAG TPA: hypothetical protein VGL03_16675 [Thermoanaerobaculia bacterium]|jgi:hypothetical protein
MIAGMIQPIITPANTSSATAMRNAIPIATHERAVMEASFFYRTGGYPGG